MANLSKIKLGDKCYNIVPQLGKGLNGDDGTVRLCIGNGLAFNKDGEVELNMGEGLKTDSESGKILVSMGTAVSTDNPETDTGIDIADGEFKIYTSLFKNFLKSLGVVFK